MLREVLLNIREKITIKLRAFFSFRNGELLENRYLLFNRATLWSLVRYVSVRLLLLLLLFLPVLASFLLHH